MLEVEHVSVVGDELTRLAAVAREADYNEVGCVRLGECRELRLDRRSRCPLADEKLGALTEGVTEQRVERTSVPFRVAQLVDLRRLLAVDADESPVDAPARLCHLRDPRGEHTFDCTGEL